MSSKWTHALTTSRCIGGMARFRTRARRQTTRLAATPLGRDVLLRLIDGARVSLGVGVVAALMSAALGGSIGLMAGVPRR